MALGLAVVSKDPLLVFLIARCTNKAEAVSSRLEIYCPLGRTWTLHLILSSMKHFPQAATELNEITESVNGLINNAGIVARRQKIPTEDGVESQSATGFFDQLLFRN